MIRIKSNKIETDKHEERGNCKESLFRIVFLRQFYKFNNPTIVYGTNASYTGANTMEINLDITNTLLENLISILLYCGEPYAGDTITL